MSRRLLRAAFAALAALAAAAALAGPGATAAGATAPALATARVAASNAEASRREATWQKFYVPSEFCKNADNRSTMECANEYARVKKEFEKRWAAGTL